ncbi:MAG: HAMP domain-containing histidine kinase [Lachnospiraceae bacterium]|nr:HAMP domain-containing histidine kinase [Lachnospiraceae bacterium]
MDFTAMDLKKKILVILGVISFLAALVLTLRGVLIVGIACFTLSSLFPVLALGEADKKDESHNLNPEGEIMVGTLQNRVEALKNDNLRLKERLKEASEENEALQIALDAEKPDKPADKTVMSSILPKGEGDDATLQTLDIAKVIKEAAGDFQSLANDAGVDIVVMDPPEPMYVNAAPVMLRTMFRDIIDNAVKYMRRSGSLQVTIANLDDDIFIAMKDNGEGLSESETVHIFELNYQGSNRISGNGLGLAQVKAIVDYYGGMIYAKSSPGRGMGIYLHLPAERK